MISSPLLSLRYAPSPSANSDDFSNFLQSKHPLLKKRNHASLQPTPASSPLAPSPSCCSASVITLIALAIIVGGGAIALGTLWFHHFKPIISIGQWGACSLIAGGSILTLFLLSVAIVKGYQNKHRPPPLLLDKPVPDKVALPTPLEHFKSLLIRFSSSSRHLDRIHIDTYENIFEKYLKSIPDFCNRYITYVERLDAQQQEFFLYTTPTKDRCFIIGKHRSIGDSSVLEWAMTSEDCSTLKQIVDEFPYSFSDVSNDLQKRPDP